MMVSRITDYRIADLLSAECCSRSTFGGRGAPPLGSPEKRRPCARRPISTPPSDPARKVAANASDEAV
eukprot:11272288-Alexandrium_andersonii.AAC.1